MNSIVAVFGASLVLVVAAAALATPGGSGAVQDAASPSPTETPAESHVAVDSPADDTESAVGPVAANHPRMRALYTTNPKHR